MFYENTFIFVFQVTESVCRLNSMAIVESRFGLSIPKVDGGRGARENFHWPSIELMPLLKCGGKSPFIYFFAMENASLKRCGSKKSFRKWLWRKGNRQMKTTTKFYSVTLIWKIVWLCNIVWSTWIESYRNKIILQTQSIINIKKRNNISVTLHS